MPSPLAKIIEEERRKLELTWAQEEQRQVELTEAEKWARDPEGWIDRFVVIASKFDAEGNPARIHPLKMELFPDQRETIRAWLAVDALQRGELRFRNLLIEKSRQIGETWTLAALVCWLLHYHASRGLFLSLRAGEVQDRDWTVDSFFGRVKYIDDHLLDRAQIPGLGTLLCRPFSSDPAVISHAERGAYLFGECQRDDPGRSKAYDYVIGDEFAFILHPGKVHSALDEACKDGKVYLSTPQGEDTEHARLCDEQPQGYTYLRLHWSTHPIYSRGLHVAAMPPADGKQGYRPPQPEGQMAISLQCPACEATIAGVPWTAREPRSHRYPGKPVAPWYDRAVIGKTDVQVAQELDIDRSGSLEARVYSEYSDARHLTTVRIPYEDTLPIELFADFGLDATAFGVCQDHPMEYRVLGLLEMGDIYGTTATPDLVAAALRRYMIDEIGVPAEFATLKFSARWLCVGDPAAQARSLSTGLPLIDEYRKAGINISPPPARLTARAETNIRAVKRLLSDSPKPLLIDGTRPGGREFARHLRNNTWPVDPQGRRRIGSTVPLDNEHNHACRGFAYLVVSKFAPPDERPRVGTAPDRDDDGLLRGGLSYDMAM